jgi:RNA-directed DNA polymerase
MRRAGALLEKIAEPENLRLAYWKAARQKLDRADAQAFGAGLDDELAALREGVLNGTAPVGQHRFFTIHDPKERMICAACFRERVLHHAIINVCEPVFERYQIAHSYACRKGRGRTAAIRQALAWTRGNGWFIHLDVHKYYDSIRHDILKQMLRRLFKDEGVLMLLERIIDACCVTPGCGLPIGHLTSQHFGNFYLARFDHHVKETLCLRPYIRYMDDMAAWSNKKSELLVLRDAALQFLSAELGLTLNASMPLNRTAHGFDFLGYRLFPGSVRLSRRSARRLRRRMAEDEARWQEGEWDDLTLVRHVEPKLAFAAEADSLGLRRLLLAARG